MWKHFIDKSVLNWYIKILIQKYYYLIYSYYIAELVQRRFDKKIILGIEKIDEEFCLHEGHVFLHLDGDKKYNFLFIKINNLLFNYRVSLF